MSELQKPRESASTPPDPEGFAVDQMVPANLSRLLESILEHTYIKAVSLDTKFRFVWVNQAYADACGRPRGFFLGKNHFDLYPHEENQAIFQQVIDSGTPYFTVAKPFVFPDQPERGVTYWDWSLYPVKGPTGAVESLVFTLVDATARVSLAKAAQESEALLQRTFDEAPVGAVLVGPDFKFVRVNSAFYGFLGYLPGELNGLSIKDVTAPEDHDATAAGMAKLLCGVADSFGVEKRYLRKDGSLVWGQTSVGVIRDAQQRISRFLAMIVDSTARHRVESIMAARLELSELSAQASLNDFLQTTLDKAESLTESCIGFFHFVDPDQENLLLQTWSHNTLRNMCTAEGAGKHYPVSQAGVWVDCLREKKPVVHNDYAHLEHKKGLPPGHAAVIRELVVPVIRDGSVVAILGVGNKASDYRQEDVELVQGFADEVVDIVTRKRAEEALQESERKFRVIADYTVDWEMWFGPDGKLVWVNPAVQRITGYSVEECLSMGDFPLPLVLAEDRAAYLRQYGKPKTGTRGEAVEFRIACKNGTVRWVSLSWQSIPDLNGVPQGHRSSIRDITRRRQLEEVARQNQKMEGIGHLAGGMAHEFNNILAAGMMNLSLLKRNPAPDDRLQCIEDIQALFERAADLVRQLLAFSRRSLMQPKALDLNQWLGDLCRTLRHLVGERIRLEFVVAPDPVMVQADRGMLQQALMNLCLNARDAMPDGGLLTIALGKEHLDEARARKSESSRPGLFACLSVCDTGRGMDAETLKRIFEPFFSTKDVGQGTGLGLSTVYGIIHQHRGWVEVESQVGSGSVFRVYLPVLPPSPAAEVASVRKEASPRGGETILIVEDEPSVRNLLGNLLAQEGYRTLYAANGQEALQIWSQHRNEVHLLFTDMVMGQGMSGLELAKALRQERPSLKVIVFSGYSSDLEGLTASPDASVTFLPKPCPDERLLPVVRDCLDGR